MSYAEPKIEGKQNSSHHSKVGTFPLNSISWAVPYAATTGLLGGENTTIKEISLGRLSSGSEFERINSFLTSQPNELIWEQVRMPLVWISRRIRRASIYAVSQSSVDSSA